MHLFQRVISGYWPINIFTVELDNGEKIYLKSFPSTKIEEFIDFVKFHKLVEDGQSSILHATGGGAYKYHDLFEKEFKGNL